MKRLKFVSLPSFRRELILSEKMEIFGKCFGLGLNMLPSISLKVYENTTEIGYIFFDGISQQELSDQIVLVQK